MMIINVNSHTHSVLSGSFPDESMS